MNLRIKHTMVIALLSVSLFAHSQKYTRSDGEKYITADEITFHLEEGDITEEYFKSEKDMVKNVSKSSSANEDEVIESSYELKDLLLEYLVELNYLDTSERFFPDYKNSLHLDMTVEEIHFRMIKPQKTGPVSTMFIEMVAVLTLKSHYGKELLKREVTDEIKIGRTTVNDDENKFETLIQNVVRSFIFDDDVQAFVTSSDYFDLEDEANFQIIQLRSKVGSKEPDSWRDAVATIISDEGHGSACVISEDGYLVTNFHVVGQKDVVNVKFSSGEKASGVVVRKQPDCDLALIKVNTTGLSYFPIASSQSKFGDAVYVLGTPADTLLSGSLFRGVLSGKRNFDGATYLQTDAKVNLGNSGGALLNKNGELIGVVSSKYVGYGIEGIGFAIPVEELSNRLKVEVQQPTPVVAPAPASKPKKKK